MKSKTKKGIDCSRCRDRKYVFINRKGKGHSEVCSCFECKICEDSRRIFEETPEGISRIRECECNTLIKKIALFNQAGVPGKFVHEEFSSYLVEPPQHRTQKNAFMVTIGLYKFFGKLP